MRQGRWQRPLGVSAAGSGVAPRDVGTPRTKALISAVLVRRTHLDLVRYLGALCTPG
ncbi:hypothetical protein GXP74_32355 [Streptacidiphilus sp. P02-A3a]|nr:hypothetical protein GXP74_32355 [Streptacidiphilus sp. P02-A3a]